MSRGLRRIAIAVGVLVVALVGAIAVREVAATNEEAIVVVHWSNSHPMREGLMPAMAEEFNDADHETAAGQPIEVVVVQCDSRNQSDDLVDRITKAVGTSEDGCKADGERAADPTIVTPQSSDWLIDVNHRSGRDVVDLDNTQNIAETWLGIVTYRAMAECLGWPDEQLGYADILALRADPDGWAAHPECARTEWGRRPLLAFTNPNTSTSGRNVLVSLYSMAADNSPADLTVADIEHPAVVEQVKDFQQLVDHYMPTTLSVNTKIAQGEEYGHFFLLPEDNLVSLYMGNEKAIGTDGTEQQLSGVSDLVMIYPEEGSVLNGNPAAIVDGSWVTADHRDGAAQWIDYLRESDQQQRFMDRGFRPASGGLEPDARQFAEWGLDVGQPMSTLEPGDLRHDVLEAIIDSWGSVKNPAIVTFVVDVSGSMSGEPIEAVKEGMFELIDAMADANSPGNDSSVGLITFESSIVEQVRPAPISESKYDIADVVGRMQATGGTALYDAVGRGIEMSDAAPGDERASRAVVVLSDGAATEGMCLADIVDVSSNKDVPLSRYCGHEGERAIDDDGNTVDAEHLIGIELAGATDHEIQVFFVGFGSADVNIGRVLAQATGAEYQGQTDDDLAAVIEELSGYF
jgi:Ca-activated chloride channel homolog